MAIKLSEPIIFEKNGNETSDTKQAFWRPSRYKMKCFDLLITVGVLQIKRQMGTHVGIFLYYRYLNALNALQEFWEWKLKLPFYASMREQGNQ
jgi:hypothetical protein